MKVVRQVNKFHQGMDGDKSAKDLSPNSYRSATNLGLMTEEKYGDLVTLQGNKHLLNFFTSVGDNFTVLNEIVTYGNIDSVEIRGIVYFTYDDTNNSNILFYDHTNNVVYKMWSGTDFGWNQDTVVDVQGYSDKGCHFVYFVDGDGYFQIEVKNYATQPLFNQLKTRPEAFTDCLEIGNVSEGGTLNAGSYMFLVRYYNTESCRYSSWSNMPNAVNITPNTDCDPSNYGGLIGQKTNKKVQLFINGTGGAGFDAVQILVIPLIDGSSTLPTAGEILPPNTDFYGPKVADYVGSEVGVQVSLTDILVDDMPLLGSSTITEKDGYMFFGNIKVNEFLFGRGDISIDAAHTIQQEVGNIETGDVYKCESNARNFRSYMREEVYAFGIFVFDEFRNGVVCPFDLSVFTQDIVWKTAYDTGEVTGQIGSYSVVTVTDGSLFATGDRISIGGFANVLSVSGNELTVDATLIAGTTGNVDLLYGQNGNQTANWAWKFPSRGDNKFTIFDENGDAMSIGIRIEGITNLPTWAKGFEIVRRERIQNVLYQIPHVPTISVEGGLSVSEQVNGENTYDYQGDLDHMAPKLHKLGVARNLYVDKDNNPGVEIAQRPSWTIQGTQTGPSEVSTLLYGLAPEYLYNNGSESFDLKEAGGGKIKIVDAVALRFKEKFAAKSEFAPELTATNKVVNVFEACERGQYLYNREGVIEEEGVQVYLKKIEDLIGFQETLAVIESVIDYQLEVAKASTAITLPRPAMKSENYSHIIQWGNTGALAAQQFTTEYIPAIVDRLFFPVVENQKALLLKIEDQIEDFSRIMARRANNNGDDYFPLISDLYSTNIYDPLYLSQDYILEGNTVSFNTSNNNAVSNGEIVAGAYIMNVLAGIGDDRYGEISDGGQWQSTGICRVLTDDEIANNAKFDVDVFGGDTFITKHSLKVSDSTPRIVAFDPKDALIQTGGSYNLHAKTGAYEKNIEIIDVYLESEINSSYIYSNDQYPKVDDEEISSYDDIDYYYHRNYSAQNNLKTLVGKQDFCKNTNRLRSAVAYSDLRVRGISSVWSTDVEGFNRIRANNYVVYDQSYGDVTKLAKIDDKAIYVIQRDKVLYQPIGINELQDLNNSVIVTGTSTLLGSGDRYLPFDGGSQHLRTVWEHDGKIYAVDQDRKVVFCFGSGGSGFDVISYNGMDAFFKSELNRTLGGNELIGGIDERNKRYFVIIKLTGREEITSYGAFYNTKSMTWESKLSTKHFASLISTNDQVFTMNQGEVYEMYEGNPLEFFGRYEDAEFEIIATRFNNQTKVLSSIEVNSNNRIDSVVGSAFTTDESLPNLVTNELNLDKNQRNGKYFQNLFRAIINNRSVKLKGQYFKLKFKILGNSTVKTVDVQSIDVNMRKSL